MRIEYIHASKFGNGVAVAKEFERQMAARGAEVSVHHVRDVKPKNLSPADLYVFSSPGRMGRPIGSMRRFLKGLDLPASTRYAILATGMAPQPDEETGRLPTEEELGKCERVVPMMHDALQAKGLVEIAQDKVFVTGLKGPLEEGWQGKVRSFAARIAEAAEREVSGSMPIPT
ncbi:MAG TPA: hypothetical protein VFP41_13495 [Actinomycetota bacterium]|nr:hypothetical protein [Actinomycetota bacterium]